MVNSQDKSPIENQCGQGNLTSMLFFIILIVGGIWVWNHLNFDTQDFFIDEIIPIFFLLFIVGLSTWMSFRKIKKRKKRLQDRDTLIQQIAKEKSKRKRFELAVELIELNNYQCEDLESITSEMAEAFIYMFKQSLGDKQHRIRGVAASHLGVVQHRDSIPLLMKALEDDHAYVRSSAALALGRMRAIEAKAKLENMMKEDWDQTVRSRSREAVERMR